MAEFAVLLAAAEVAAIAPAQLLLVDCRFDLANPSAGEQAYLDGHLPGAVYANLDQDLSDLSRSSWGLGRHPLPASDAFAASLGRWGWTGEQHIVAYDSAGGALAAARLWWLCRLAGIGQVSVLDGGLAAWTAHGGGLESGAVQRAASTVQLQFQSQPQAVAEELTGAVASGQSLLLDARAEPRFKGEIEPLDPIAGHVPGARNRPFQHNLDSAGRFRPALELRQEFEALLAGRSPQQVIHMCGSGVTACHNLLAMEYAGLAGSRLYPPSWSGWVSEPGRRVATGA